MDRNHNKPVVLYVVGYVRSGSTLLDRLLGSIDGFHSCGEIFELWRQALDHRGPCSCGQHAEDCPFWAAVLEKTFDDAPSSLKSDVLKFANLFYSTINKRNLVNLIFPRLRSQDFQTKLKDIEILIGKLYRAIAEVSDAQVIVDSSKYPLYAYLLSESNAVDLHLVHLVRDSRAVVYSHIRKKFVSEIGYTATKKPFRTVLAWSLHNVLAERLRANHRYVRVRYEDLAAHPKETILYIVETLGLAEKVGVDESKLFASFSGENKIVLGRGHLIAGNAMRFKHGEIKIKLDTEWKNSLPLLYKLAITVITAPLLKRYGYNIGLGTHNED